MDTSEPSVRQLVESRVTVCLDAAADDFAALTLTPGGVLTVARFRVAEE